MNRYQSCWFSQETLSQVFSKLTSTIHVKTCEIQRWEMLLFTDPLLTEAAICFLIPDFTKVHSFVKAAITQSVLKNSSENFRISNEFTSLKNLYCDHKFLRKCGRSESFCRHSSSQYVFKTYWRRVEKTSLPWVIRFKDVLKTSWSRFENVLKAS